MARPNGSNGHGSNGHTDREAMRDWVLVATGLAYVLGKLGVSEEIIRGEMKANASAAPVATLYPAYIVDARVHMIPAPQGVGVVRNIDVQRLDWVQGDGGKPVPWHTTLTMFAFVSDMAEPVRKRFLELVDTVERSARARESGVVLATGA